MSINNITAFNKAVVDEQGQPAASTRFLAMDEVLDTWRDWGLSITGRPRVIAPVLGGRTNRSYQVRAPGLGYDLLLRINNLDAHRLGIDREREAGILQLAAGVGLTRGACYWDPERRFTLFRHVTARTWTDRDYSDPSRRRRLLECMGLIHSQELDRPRHSYYGYLCRYWQQLEDASVIDAKLRREWDAFRPDLKAFDEGSWEARLTHHDLIPENILENERQIYLIDWEYAALGHPDIDYWCLDPSLVREPFIHDLAQWTNDLWERIARLLRG